MLTSSLLKTERCSMETYIIIGVVLLLLFVGVYSSLKHFKGKGGCCGGGGYKPKKKKLSNILYTKTFYVDGMHCNHCKNRVEEIVNDIKGISGKVDLSRGELKVSYAEDVPDEIIISRIEKAGYTTRK